MAEKIATREAYGKALAALADKYPDLVCFDADLAGATMTKFFKDACPERFFDMGIAEADMVGVAAGLAITGKVPFIGSFAEFVTGRVYDQLRQEVAYGHTNVKIASSHAGITLGEDGATHQTMEDLALMRALPGMTVLVPCDYNQTKNATIAAAKFDGPVYLRFGRPSVPNFTGADEPFEIGKIYNLNEGTDVTLITCGHLVWEALEAAEALEAEGISAEVLNVATVKPLDEKTIIESVAKTGCAVVAEEHNMAGGLGEAVAGVLAANAPAALEFVNGKDRFGQSGTPAELMKAYGLDAAHIAEAAKKAIARKK